jgi:hypothetical protein
MMITPRWGFEIVCAHTHRALPCAIDLRAFSHRKRCINLFYRCHLLSVLVPCGRLIYFPSRLFPVYAGQAVHPLRFFV